MKNENLLVNGIDHGVFDLEWAEHGGIVNWHGTLNKMMIALDDGHVSICNLHVCLRPNKASVIDLRMATQDECCKAGIKYINPPFSDEKRKNLQANIEQLTIELQRANLDLAHKNSELIEMRKRLDELEAQLEASEFHRSENLLEMSNLYLEFAEARKDSERLQCLIELFEFKEEKIKLSRCDFAVYSCELNVNAKQTIRDAIDVLIAEMKGGE